MGNTQKAEPGSKVVGIGASAGGLAALRQFLEATPAGSGLSFVIVVHLAPDHPSYLSDLLQPYSSMPVLQVTDPVKLEPNNVYVIPPGRNIISIDTHLRLSPLEKERRLRAPIDHFFETLAASHTTSAVGVVLSGTGSDGAAGLKKIKYSGGLTVVQDPNQSEYDGMPQSAIATGLVDLILPVGEIPSRILSFTATAPHLNIPRNEREELSFEDQKVLHNLLAQLRNKTGHDFSRYKESTVLQRIRRRMRIRQVEDLAAYLHIIRESADEKLALVDDLLITVSSFFRDPETFQKLKEHVLPLLFTGKTAADRVRIWSVGCATGEEAYSLAILLLEFVDGKQDTPELQVFASDLHQRSLTSAREGFYSENIEPDVTPERLGRFFSKVPGGYQVRKEVRSMVVFASHNLLRDPPFSQIDLICCRNSISHLKRDMQDAVMRLFHYALNPGRFLLIDSPETVERSDLFRLADKKGCLYIRGNLQNSEAGSAVLPFFGHRTHPEAVGSPHAGIPAGLLHQRMVERYAPPSVLIDHQYNIVHLSENAGTYLVQTGGGPTNNILRRIRPELQAEAVTLLREVTANRKPVRSRPVLAMLNGERRQVTLRASTSADSDLDSLILLIFDESEAGFADKAPGEPSNTSFREIGEELELNKRRLRTLIEEYQSSQQEMQTANEEMQSTNEELRSTMEELETSKEELQSINEELQTVNQENKHRVEELKQLTSDLQNLLAATGIATLFLDRGLRILRFTPRVSELFNIRAVDRGRPLSDLTHRLGYPGMLDDAQEVLAKLIPIEREARSDDGSWFLTRMLPYRTSDDRIEGVVLTLVDISRLKTAEQASEESDERYRLLVENVREYAIFMLDSEGCMTTWNTGAQRLFGYEENETVGQTFEMMSTPEDRAAGFLKQELRSVLRDGQSSEDRCYVRRDGTSFWASGVTTPLRLPNGELRGFSKVMRDNTERRRSQAELESRNVELMRTNRELEEFAYVASHDLQEPLRMINIYSKLLLQFVDVEHSERAKQFAGFISTGAHRMGALISDLLGYSRVVHEELEQSETTDSADALNAVLQTLDDRIHETNASISFDKFPVVYGQEQHIGAVFQNLLSNALKYKKPDEPPRIHISVARTGAEWLFKITDNGIGFAPEYSDRIFGLFKRLHKNSYPGTGLGLAICKQIVERNGGKIWATSKGDGFGATFSFTLRAVAAESVSA